MKKFIDVLWIKTQVRRLVEVLGLLLVWAAHISFGSCAIVGAIWLAVKWLEVRNEGKLPAVPLYQNIILDETRLVRCAHIDRSMPACTMLSQCEDGVDRCVIVFEILRRAPRPADYLPTEAQD